MRFSSLSIFAPSRFLTPNMVCLWTTAVHVQFGDGLPEAYMNKHNVSPMWHSQSWPRTVYNKKST